MSGAAASPNMGLQHFAARRRAPDDVQRAPGVVVPESGRPERVCPVRSASYYLVKELFGIADEKGHFINVSDGGHFENLGIYELIRRRCKVIIACDAECDSSLVVRQPRQRGPHLRDRFRRRASTSTSSRSKQKESGTSRRHCTVGRITYANGSQGYLIYLKSSISGDEDVGIAQYLAAHPEFPHEPTGDQFFAEDQFESLPAPRATTSPD